MSDAFAALPLWLDLLLMALAGGVVWFAGTRMAGYANAIAEVTGLGKALVGMVVLGAVTSLPEFAVSVTAALKGAAALAVNNALGGVAMQVVIVALGDALIRRNAISSVVPRPIVMLQGVLCVVLLIIVAAGVIVGEPAGWPVGAWSTLVLLGYLVALFLLRRYDQRMPWTPARGERPSRPAKGGGKEERSLRTLLLYVAGAAAALVSAGFVLAQTGEAVAEKTGLGESFVGAMLIALATSLPEISTVVASARIRQYELVFGDIFGTNLFDIVLIFVIDAVSAGDPVLSQVGVFSAFAALLGAIVTSIYIAGLLERADRTVLRMGVDSLAVIVVYAAGAVVLFYLR
jgi:cation:H+ antiporter